MKQLATFETWYGRDEAPPESIRLKAGELELIFQEGTLRAISYAGQELVRQIYAAVRDVNWNTIPAEVSNLKIDAAGDHFHIQFDAAHRAGELAFRWQAEIEGKADGVISYALDGLAESDFRYCRIGFCLLHPIKGTAGSPYRAATPGGDVSGILPELIEPQRMENGFEAPLFPSFSSLVVTRSDGIKVFTEFEGDLFEMEDQRNWTDGSFKTYCTPLSLGYPHQARAGQTFHQKVTVWTEIPENFTRTETGPGRLTFGTATGQRLPKIGFGMAGHGQNLNEQEIELLSRLQPDHIRAEIHFKDPAWPASLDRAVTTVRQLNSALELVLFLTDIGAGEALETLKQRLIEAPVARVIVFHEAEAAVGTTSSHWIRLVREHLSGALPGASFVGGTNGNFAELNRQRPDISVMDGVAYTINPQVHMSDERSLLEAIEGQQDTVTTARSFCGALPICISAVTLKPPFNQAATEEEAAPDPDQLPPSVDPRQMSLFGAAWTVASLRALALAGAASLTYYETSGWRGLLETTTGSPLPEKFRSFPGMVFPVYWLFAFLAGAKEAALLNSTSDQPLLVDGLAFEKGSRTGVLVANLQPYPQEIQLRALPRGQAAITRLNEQTLEAAAFNPSTFPTLSEPFPLSAGEAVLGLAPYETAFLDIQRLKE